MKTPIIEMMGASKENNRTIKEQGKELSEQLQQLIKLKLLEKERDEKKL